LRQLASGRVPVAVALALMAALLVAAAATIAFAPLPKSFAVTSPSISRSTFGYSLGIKHFSVIELVLGDSGMLATSSSSQWPSRI